MYPLTLLSMKLVLLLIPYIRSARAVWARKGSVAMSVTVYVGTSPSGS